MKKHNYKNILFLLITFLIVILATGCALFSPSKFYKVAFYNDSKKINEYTVKEGSPMVKIPDLTKDGYILLGWDLDQDGNPDEIPDVVTSDLRLDAIFKKQGEFKIDFYNYDDTVITTK